MRFRRRQLLRLLPPVLASLAAVSLLVGVTSSVNEWRYITNPPPSAPSTKPVAKSALDSYTVAADMPRYLIIPALHIKARILAVGLTKDGAVGTPANVFDTAWYTGSSKPGIPGAALIDGHVSSWTTDGVFHSLKQLRTGNIIQIARGDGTIITYDVVRLQTYDHNNVDMASVLAPATPGGSSLNLITCTGDVISGTNEFSQRLAVFTRQV